LFNELAEIDENLIRNELHFTERGDLLVRKKVIYEELYPETKQGISGGKASGVSRGTNEINSFVKKPSFVEDTANKTGESKRTIETEMQISKNITPEIKQQIKEQNITKTEALEIARATKEIKKEFKQNAVMKTEEEIKDEIEAKAKEKAEAMLKQIEEEKAIKSENKKQLLELKKQENIENLKKEITENKPTIKLADCNEFLKEFEDESIDLLITDPPYSTDVADIREFAKGWLPTALRKVKKTGRAYICIGAYPKEMQAYFEVLLNQDKFILDNPLIWTYRNTLGVTPKAKYNLNYQVILHLYSNDSKDLDTSITNEMFSVMDINSPDGRQGNRFHTWQKPDELAMRLIKHSTSEGDLVVDCFACTGTFLLMAAKMKRKAKGCEISRDNIKIGGERGCIIIGE